MGNCFVVEERKVASVMKMEGGGDHQVPMAQLGGRDHDPTAGVGGGGQLRIKLVVSKQELKAMLSREVISLEDMISLLHKEANKGSERDKERSMQGWRPALESIPEGNDFSS
ncbi:hypothetical protein ACMD2_26393 [Ananas comosus]|uniref:Uncharacterized protein n=1 Tax=Ananas comosus TaxID=4615 RepID=A0A199UNU2_ANACO|nr:hypothetical protein ACMD2_26393 [Ananas comosus]